MIFSLVVMYKFILYLIFSFSIVMAQLNKKSIHQTELEYNNTFYLEPKFKPASVKALPLTPRKKGSTKIVFGYHPYWSGTKWKNYDFELLTTIAYFSAESNGNGELTNLHGWPATDLINKAHTNGVEVVLTVTLFNKSDLESLLSSSQNRNRLINNLTNQVANAGADGVNIDFEAFPASQKSNLVIFTTDLRESLRAKIPNAKVTLATPAVDWSNAWDFNGLANASDGLFIMGYDYHWSGSANTGPVAPLTGGSYNITNTINTYLLDTGNNSKKIILGNPYYGYQWPANSGNKGSSTRSTGSSVIYTSAETNAKYHGKIWDNTSQSPWYKYQDNGWFQAWYDDSLSLSKKYDLALEKDLSGIGIWALGYDDETDKLWKALKEKVGGSSKPNKPIGFNVTNLGNGVISIDFQKVKSALSYSVTRIFDNSDKIEDYGSFTEAPILLQNLSSDSTYFFKVNAKNEFGLSKFTEVLGINPSVSTPKILIVNGFDRINGTKNSFNYIIQHGLAIQNLGYAFDASSNEAVINGNLNLNDYLIVDWILGEEGSSSYSFDNNEQTKVTSFLKNGGRLFVSGSEIGYDLVEKGNSSDKDFYYKILKSSYLSDAPAGKQGVYDISGVPGTIFDNIYFSFDNGTMGTYDVDFPDGIKPSLNAESILHFNGIDYDTKGGAGVAYRGRFLDSPSQGALIYLTIGFEAIFPEQKRFEIMSRIVKYLEGPIASTNNDSFSIPEKIKIISLYPNPSNRSISIEFSVEQFSPIAYLSITDLKGRNILKMSVQPLATKTQKFTWNGLINNGQEAPSGVYIARLSQGMEVVSKKFTLLK